MEKAIARKKQPAIICDIDGTVALMNGKRSPFEYEKAFWDEPNKPVINMLHAACDWYSKLHNELVTIIFTSARENKVLDTPDFTDVADLTTTWIDKHIITYGDRGRTIDFRFRKAGDYRKDAYVKFELGKELMEDYNILCVFDDRNQVVDMWRNGLGLQCFQVADGNF